MIKVVGAVGGADEKGKEVVEKSVYIVHQAFSVNWHQISILAILLLAGI